MRIEKQLKELKYREFEMGLEERIAPINLFLVKKMNKINKKKIIKNNKWCYMITPGSIIIKPHCNHCFNWYINTAPLSTIYFTIGRNGA